MLLAWTCVPCGWPTWPLQLETRVVSRGNWLPAQPSCCTPSLGAPWLPASLCTHLPKASLNPRHHLAFDNEVCAALAPSPAGAGGFGARPPGGLLGTGMDSALLRITLGRQAARLWPPFPEAAPQAGANAGPALRRPRCCCLAAVCKGEVASGPPSVWGRAPHPHLWFLQWVPTRRPDPKQPRGLSWGSHSPLLPPRCSRAAETELGARLRPRESQGLG